MKERYKNEPEFRAKQHEAYKKWVEKKKGVIQSPAISCTDSDVAVAKDL
jgi:glutaredoxin